VSTVETEYATLHRIVQASSERVDRVRRARALFVGCARAASSPSRIRRRSKRGMIDISRSGTEIVIRQRPLGSTASSHAYVARLVNNGNENAVSQSAQITVTWQ
jgi:hypothetical protein